MTRERFDQAVRDGEDIEVGDPTLPGIFRCGTAVYTASGAPAILTAPGRAPFIVDDLRQAAPVEDEYDEDDEALVP